MFETRYRREIDQIGLPEERLEQLITAMGQTEPQKPSQRAGKTWKTVLLAAAFCAVLAATALAVSPGLREALAAALGAFAPYSREIECVSVIDQGIEVRVVSALCDGNAARVYFEIQDLEGDRLDEFTCCDLDITPANWSEEGDVRWSAIGGGGDLFRYDPASKTILASAELLGGGPPASKLTLNLHMTEIQPGGARDDVPKSPIIRGEWRLTVETEMVEQISIDMLPSQTVIADVTARTLNLSVLGATIESDTYGNGLNYPLTLYLSDGRVLPHIKYGPLGLSGNYTDTRWTFPEPVEPEDVVAIAIGQWYVPIESGVAGPGHWLPEQP